MAVTSGRNTVFKLIARGVELDLFQDETIYLSNNVTGLFDLGLLPSDFTRQITLPGTKINNAFFQHVYDISIDEPYLFKTNEKVIAQFDFDGFYVSQGYLQLERVNLRENKYVESYEVSVYGLLSSFKRDLQSLTLTELTTVENYNHVFSAGNILNSWSGSSYGGGVNSEYNQYSIFTSSIDGHNLGGEIIYCLSDGGKQIAYQSTLPNNIKGINAPGLNTGGEITPQNFKPAMRLDLLIDAIFNQTEYSYESTFLTENRFDNTYVLLDRGLRFPIINGVDLETFGQIEVGPVSGSSTPLTLSAGVTASLNFTNVYYDPSLSISDSAGTYTPFFGSSQVSGTTALVELTLNMKVTGSNTAYPILSLYRANDPATPSGYQVRELTNMNAQIRRDFLSSSGDKDFTLTEQLDFTFLSGSSYDWNIGFVTGGSGALNVIIGPGGNEQSRLKVLTLDQLGELSDIDMAENMPFGTNGITCLDFLSSLQKKFNLQIYPSKTKPRHFIIETFNNWYKQGKVKNFDNFVDLDKRISVIPANNLGVREVEFGDTLDGDYLAQNFSKENNREYSKSYFRDTQNFFSEGKLEVKTGFGVSPLRYVAGSGTEGSAVSRLTAFQGYFSNLIGLMCGPTYNTYYSYDPIVPGVGDFVYYDSLGNSPVTGLTYFRHNLSGDIYQMNTSTGQIQSIVSNCSEGGGGSPTS
jgi:hypothetical protein